MYDTVIHALSRLSAFVWLEYVVQTLYRLPVMRPEMAEFLVHVSAPFPCEYKKIEAHRDPSTFCASIVKSTIN